MKLIATDKHVVKGRAWPMYRALVGIATLCSVLIVGGFYLTQPLIEEKRRAKLEDAIFKVLPGAVRKSVFFLSPDGAISREQPAGRDVVTLYAGYDRNNSLVGIAIQGNGMGYQDSILLLYGYSPALESIIGMQVLDSRETPGLGDRIEKDTGFLGNFRALDVTVDTATGELRHPVVAVKHGTKTQPWEIDGITGATISSQSVANLIQQSASTWIPKILQQQQKFLAMGGHPETETDAEGTEQRWIHDAHQ